MIKPQLDNISLINSQLNKSFLTLPLWVLSHSLVSNSVRPHGLWPTRLLCPWNSPARILEWVAMSSSRGSSQPRDQTQVSCIWRQILYCLSPQGSPWILEQVVYPFSRGSSWLRNWTGISCIAGWFFTSWATTEATFPLDQHKSRNIR